MPQMIMLGSEMIRIHPAKKTVEYSTSQGRSWSSRYTSSSCGEFECLMDGGRELLAQTSKGLYYSTSSGRSWSKRR